MQTENGVELADDLLTGADDIAKFLGARWTARKVYHAAEKNSLPLIRLPNSKIIHSRKSLLRKAFSAAAK